MIKYLCVLLFVMCSSGEVRLVKEDSLKKDTESLKKEIISFEKKIRAEGKEFPEERFDALKEELYSYMNRCTAVEKQKDDVIRDLTNTNFSLNEEIKNEKIKAAVAIQKEVERSAIYRDKAGKWEGLVYTLSALCIALLIACGIYIYMQAKGIGFSAVTSLVGKLRS